MTQNEHAYAICCRLEAAGDVISFKNVTTSKRYALLNFEVANWSTVRDIKENHFATAEAAAAVIDDGTNRKRIRVSLKKLATFVTQERFDLESHCFTRTSIPTKCTAT